MPNNTNKATQIINHQLNSQSESGVSNL